MLASQDIAVKQKQPASAGRPRQFVPETALQNALDIFWHKGFQATSLADLTEAMGLSRSSFYACFGSKQALYAEAVHAYGDRYFDTLVASAQSTPDPLLAVRAVLAAVADTSGGPQGCFFVNTVTELAPHDPDVTRYCQRHIARVAQLVTELLVQAGFTPQLASDRAAAALALAVGLITLRKAGLEPQRLEILLGQVEHLLLPPQAP